METKYKPVFGDRVRHKKHGLGLVFGKGVLPNATIVQWYKNGTWKDGPTSPKHPGASCGAIILDIIVAPEPNL